MSSIFGRYTRGVPCARGLVVAWVMTLAVAGVVLQPVRATDGVVGLDGRPVTPLEAGASATVLVFTAVECPISGRYAPAVRRLAESFRARGVRVWLVYPNAGETPAHVRAHAAAFLPGLPVALDTARTLADRAAATVTPEAAVFDRSGRLRYHGRIDDRYLDFGVDRPVPTSHDLADALTAVLDGRPVTVSATRAVGCAIVRQQP